MKILAFDIGIQNLSYCYFTLNIGQSNLFTIHTWNVVSINESTCCYVSKRKTKNVADSSVLLKTCNVGAKFLETDKMYCSKHKTKQSIKMKDDLLDLHVRLIKRLDEIQCEPDYVVIENQPKFNPKMKTIAAAIYTYFAARLRVNSISNLRDIAYIHPSYKVTKVPYNGDPIKDLPKDKYKRYKQLGIIYTRYFLRKQNNWLDFFEEHQKKDDLADAFLNGFAYAVLFLQNMKVKDLQNLYDITGTKSEIMKNLIYNYA